MTDWFSPEEINRRFTYHPDELQHYPVGDQSHAYKDIRDEALKFAHLLCGRVPPSRELSLALTKLEECVMHANSGIARRSQ